MKLLGLEDVKNPGSAARGAAAIQSFAWWSISYQEKIPQSSMSLQLPSFRHVVVVRLLLSS